MKAIFRHTLLLMLPLLLIACKESQTEEEEQPIRLVYGIEADRYRLETSEILSGETVGGILGRHGLSARMIDRLDRAAKPIFPLRKIRPGRRYTLFLETDSLQQERLAYMAYEKSITEYVVFGFHGDSISITEGEKPKIISCYHTKMYEIK